MEIIIGVVIGLVLVGGAIAIAFRAPSKPLKKRSESDHDDWNDSGGIAGNFGQPPE
jgi:hypothetical protein